MALRMVATSVQVQNTMANVNILRVFLLRHLLIQTQPLLV